MSPRHPFLAILALAGLILPIAAQAETPLPEGGFRDCPDCPAMKEMPDGSAMGIYPVTVDEFRVFAAETGVEGITECFIWNGTKWRRRAETGWAAPGYEQAGDHPVVCVNWLEATGYTDWLSDLTGYSYRLPTIEESAEAAAADAPTAYWWGDDFAEVCAHANVADDAFRRTYPDDTRPILSCADGYPNTNPVTAFAPNPHGLHDTLGNVWEWTNSCLKGDCSNAIFRGAAWATPFPKHFAKDGQWADRILLRNSGIGFRVMRDAE